MAWDPVKAAEGWVGGRKDRDSDDYMNLWGSPGTGMNILFGQGDIDFRADAPQMGPQQQMARAAHGRLGGIAGKWATTGEGPSAAQQLLARQRGANISQAQSAAKSMAGANPYLAQRMSQGQAATANLAAGEQAAIMRAQEQQMAMQQALQAAEAQRTQDIQAYQAQTAPYMAAQQMNAQIAAQEAANDQGMLGGLLSGAKNIVGGLGKKKE